MAASRSTSLFDVRFGDSTKLLALGAVIGLAAGWFLLSDFRLRGLPTNIPGVMSSGQARRSYEGELQASFGELGPAGSPDNQLRYMPPPPSTVNPSITVTPTNYGDSRTSAGGPDNQIRYIPPIGSGGGLPFGLNANPEGIQTYGAMWNTIGGYPANAARDKMPVPVIPQVLVQADNIHWS